jgi:hypothetical protein
MRASFGARYSTPRQRVTKHESQFAHQRDLYWLVELSPAAREKLVEQSTMNTKHYRRGARRRTATGSNRLGGSCVMAFGAQGKIAAQLGKPRLRQHRTRCCCEYAVRVQQPAWKEQPVPLGIPGEIVKYICELHCTAQLLRGALPRRRVIAEYAQQEPVEGDRRALAIAIQLRKARRPNIGLRLHLCAVDDGETLLHGSVGLESWVA